MVCVVREAGTKSEPQPQRDGSLCDSAGARRTRSEGTRDMSKLANPSRD